MDSSRLYSYWRQAINGDDDDDSPGEKCEPVIIFECMDLSIVISMA